MRVIQLCLRTGEIIELRATFKLTEHAADSPANNAPDKIIGMLTLLHEEGLLPLTEAPRMVYDR